MKSRYYDPAAGRFINADEFTSTGQGILGCNMFAYCNNGPVCFSDSLGSKPIYSLDVNEDGEADCFVYCYVFDNLIDGGRSVGYVYFYQGVDKAFFEDKSNWPEGFDPKIDLLVGVLNVDTNPTLYAYQAQKLKRKHREDVISIMFEFASDFDLNWGRSEDSVLIEWRSHMFFAPVSKRAQDVDFDRAEEGKNFWFYADKARRAFQKLWNSCWNGKE